MWHKQLKDESEGKIVIMENEGSSKGGNDSKSGRKFPKRKFLFLRIFIKIYENLHRL